MKRIILLATLVFSACQAKNVTIPSSTAKFATINQNSTIATGKVAPELLISADGIGNAKLGMTLGELKKISNPDTEFDILPSFMGDLDAIAVSENGVVQYYIVYIAKDDTESATDTTTISDNLVITNVMTDNHNYQTEQGVKVGTSIKEAEEIYGDAVLAYNTEGESREYITFGSKNPENISFRASYFKLISEGLGFSGIYPEYPGVSYTTNKYRQDAAIAGIEVSCNLDECSNSTEAQ